MRLPLAALAILALARCAGPTPVYAAVGDGLPPLGAPTYALTFDRPATPTDFNKVYPGLSTWAYFGNEGFGRAKGLKMTQAQRFTSRAWPGTLNVYVDPDYCPGSLTPKVSGGSLKIDQYRFASKADVATCGQGLD